MHELLEQCLNTLKNYSKEDLLKETEQLLLSLLERDSEKGKDLQTLKSLKEYWENGGLNQRNG